MRAPVAFTGDTILVTDGAATPTALPEVVRGIAFTGFTAVVIYNGSSTSGDVVANCTAAGTYSFGESGIYCDKGVYLDTTGTGKGTVWLV